MGLVIALGKPSADASGGPNDPDERKAAARLLIDSIHLKDEKKLLEAWGTMNALNRDADDAEEDDLPTSWRDDD